MIKNFHYYNKTIHPSYRHITFDHDQYMYTMYVTSTFTSAVKYKYKYTLR